MTFSPRTISPTPFLTSNEERSQTIGVSPLIPFSQNVGSWKNADPLPPLTWWNLQKCEFTSTCWFFKKRRCDPRNAFPSEKSIYWPKGRNLTPVQRVRCANIISFHVAIACVNEVNTRSLFWWKPKQLAYGSSSREMHSRSLNHPHTYVYPEIVPMWSAPACVRVELPKHRGACLAQGTATLVHKESYSSWFLNIYDLWLDNIQNPNAHITNITATKVPTCRSIYHKHPETMF